MSTRVRAPMQPVEVSEYYRGYTSLVPGGDIVALLREQQRASQALLATISEQRAEHRYAQGKWTVKEVVGHLTDTEWTFTYRAMRFARGDATELPGVDQDVLVAGADFATRSLASLAQEWRELRAANTTLFESLGDQALDRRGVASGNEFTVRGILYVIAGHELHHVNVLRERYL